ncbi:MAG: hypothetical protein SGPRY_011107, partial [Prymnesium sp.]
MQADSDNSGDISREEFTHYVTQMTRWMRAQLIEQTHHKNVFSALVSKSIEMHMVPVLPSRNKVPAVVCAPKFGMRLELCQAAHDKLHGKESSAAATPSLASAERELPASRKIGLSTISLARTAHLFDADVKRRGQFAFSPVVQIEHHIEGEDASIPSGVVLVMPHCFSPQEGLESLVMLGYVENICQVRIYIMSLPIVPRDLPTSIRLHMMPDLPDQMEELEISDNAEWGLSKLAGKSDVLLLYQGARFEFTLQGETRSLTWRGTRISTTFTYTPSHDLPAGEPSTEKIWLSVCEGEGRRAARAGAVAKRAGISATGYSVSFSVTPCATVPPAPPRDVQFYERTQWDFTITWRPPDISPGNDRPITKYALELSVFGASGT